MSDPIEKRPEMMMPSKQNRLGGWIKKHWALLISVLSLILIINLLFWLNYFGAVKLYSYWPALKFLPTQKRIILTLAKVQDKEIYPKDVDQQLSLIWGRYTAKELPNPQSRQNALLDLIEEEIIRIETKNLGIAATAQEIDEEQNKRIKQAGGKDLYQAALIANQWNWEGERNKIQNGILKRKIENQVVGWRLIDGVSTYLNPLAQEYPTLKNSAVNSLEKVKTLLSQGKTASESAEEALKDYKAINKFVVHEIKKIEKADDWDKKIKEGIFLLGKGQVSNVLISASGGSFWVVRIIDSSSTAFDSYDNWLKAKKKQYAVIY